MYVPPLSGFHSNIRKYLGAPGATQVVPSRSAYEKPALPLPLKECLSPDTSPSKSSHYESVWGWHIFEEWCKTFSISSSRLIVQLTFSVSKKCFPSPLPPVFMDFLLLPFNNKLSFSEDVQIGDKNEIFQNTVKFSVKSQLLYIFNY